MQRRHEKGMPMVGVPANVVMGGTDSAHPFHRVGNKYVTGIIEGSGCLPVPIPALGGWYDFDDLVDRFDGIFLTGSPSNVEPHHYDGPPSREGTAHDPARDATSLPLIRAAVARGVPVFAVCLGNQELNVALGGSLHQLVHELPGKNEHRMNRALPNEQRYRERHPVTLTPGGLLQQLAGGAAEVMVNSLHAQAIDRPAPGLLVEAISDDGVIEAVSMPDAKGFVLGVQWHPEHPVSLAWPLSQAIFRAFGDACRACRAARAARRAA